MYAIGTQRSEAISASYVKRCFKLKVLTTSGNWVYFNSILNTRSKCPVVYRFTGALQTQNEKTCRSQSVPPGRHAGS